MAKRSPSKSTEPRWDDLRYALAVSRAGSIVGAARALGVSPSTVFRRLEACERAMRERLFDRLPNGVEPTAAGVALLEVAERFETQLASVRDGLAQDREGLAGRVTLTTFEGIGFWVAERLESFRERYPDVQVSLEVAPEMRDVRAGHADLALWAATRPRPELVGRKVGTVAFAIYGHRARAMDPATASWIVFDDLRKQTPQGRWEAEHVPPEKVAVRVSSRALHLDLVGRGLGVGVVPCALGESRRELERLSEPMRKLDRPLWLLFNPEHPQNERTRALMEFLIEELTLARPSLEGRKA